jgi:hypothetical protein
MTTSGTYTFSLDIEALISEALDLVGGEITSGAELKKARTSLNLLLLDLANRGTPLSGLENRTLALTAGTSTYTLPSEVQDVLSLVLSRDDTDTPIERIPLMEFHKISNKTQQGLPTQCAIDRKRTAIEIQLYLVPENSTDVVNYWCKRKIQDAGTYTNTPDMNTRYFPALVFGLAYFISLKRDGFDPAKRKELADLYTSLLDSAATEDSEQVSFKVTPFNYIRRR